MTQFHLYLDGEPTKGIFDTLEQAMEAYKEEASAGQNVEIRTINSSSPMMKWCYDKAIDQWVQGA